MRKFYLISEIYSEILLDIPYPDATITRKINTQFFLDISRTRTLF